LVEEKMKASVFRKALVFTDVDDAAYAVYKLLEDGVRRFLDRYRRMKEELVRLRNSFAAVTAEISVTEGRIREVSARIPQVEGTATYAMLGCAILFALGFLFLLSDLSGLGYILLLIALPVLIFWFNKRSEIDKLREELARLQGKLEKLRYDRRILDSKITEMVKEISSFKLPEAKVRAYVSFVPVALVRNPLGNGSVVITPWSEGEVFRVSMVSQPEAVEEAMERLLAGENLYLEAIIREKDSGYKVERGLKQLKLWEKVVKSRSPELVLEEAARDFADILSTAIEQEEQRIRLEELDDDSEDFLLKLLPKAEEGDGVPMLEDSVKVLEEEVERLNYVVEIAEQLRGLRSYVKEAREILRKRDAYRSIVEEAVKNLIAATLPLDEKVLDFAFSTYYCRHCADEILREYVPFIDFRRWVYDQILGGVDRDPDIVSPAEIVRDFIKEKWREIDENVYRTLPLPGVKGDEPFDEMVRNYRDALKRYALPFTGSEENISLSWESAFTPPSIKCNRCGRELSAGDVYVLYNLKHPVIRGYVALLSEKQEEFSRKSSEIINAVNSARLHKDQRKTAIGVYEQMIKDFERDDMRVEREIEEAEEHLKMLKRGLAPIIAGAAALSVADVLSDTALSSLVGEIVKELKGGEEA